MIASLTQDTATGLIFPRPGRPHFQIMYLHKTDLLQHTAPIRSRNGHARSSIWAGPGRFFIHPALSLRQWEKLFRRTRWARSQKQALRRRARWNQN